MRIRGNDKISSYLERSGALLELTPTSFDPSLAEEYAETRLEIGCGRGAFLAKMATQNPNVLFVGVEKFVPIIARAAALCASNDRNNVRFYRMDIGKALDVFPTGSFARIYLNFSDPWPKRRHEKHRLTHPRFLSIYEKLLAPFGVVELKTDNEPFFEWSLDSVGRAGWQLIEVDRSVADIAPQGNEHEGRFAQTEYETRFRGLGQPIFFLSTKPPRQ